MRSGSLTPGYDIRKGKQMIIPNKIHFIWFGHHIPMEDLLNIISIHCRNPHYEVNIWADSYGVSGKTIRNLDICFPQRIRIRKISEIFERIPVFLGSQYTWECRTLHSLFLRQLNGAYHNYASASDIARLVILCVEGGTYFDVDVRLLSVANVPARMLNITNPDRWDRKQMPLNIHTESGLLMGDYYVRQWNGKSKSFLGNSIMSVAPGADIIKKALISIILYYELNKLEKNHVQTLWQDVRKDPVKRFMFTLEMAGPVMLRGILTRSPAQDIDKQYLLENTIHDRMFEKVNADAEWQRPDTETKSREWVTLKKFHVKYSLRLQSESPF